MPDTSEPFTLRSAAGLPTLPPPIADSILVIIDAQVEYSPAGLLPLPGLDPAVDRIIELLTAAREAGTPVIHVAHHGKEGGMFDLNHGGRFLSGIEVEPGEAVVHKTLPNCFAGTDLAGHLDNAAGRPLIFVGFMTHMCVSSTARAALDLGLNTTVVSDATATRDLPSTEGTEPIPAEAVHQAALAALADRFSFVVSAVQLLD